MSKSNQEDPKSTHRIYLNNPSELLGHLLSRVKVVTKRGDAVTGGLLAVDPVSDTAVLVTEVGETLETSKVRGVYFVLYIFFQFLGNTLFNGGGKFLKL